MTLVLAVQWRFPKWIWVNSVNHDKIQNDMVTRGITHLETNKLPVVDYKVYLHYHLWVLMPFTTLNRYWPTDSSGKSFCHYTNVSIARYRVSLVTILLLNFVLIHWIHLGKTRQWIPWRSFRENSNVKFFPVRYYLLS